MLQRQTQSLLYVTLAVFAAACDSTEPSVPTTVTLIPSALSFDAIGDRKTVHAEVYDQRGDLMFDVPLTWASSGPAVSVVAAEGDSAFVTSAAGGTATVKVQADAAIGELTATVTQIATALQKVDGDGQTGTVGTSLPTPLKVVVRDRLGAGVPGKVVAFVVTSGGGSLSSATATTGDDGTASVTWILGTNSATAQTVSASVEGVATPVVFTATARAGPPANIAIQAGNGQSATVNTNVLTDPAVRVTDSFGNPVSGVVVTFEVLTGGGSVTGGTQTTNSAGIATVTSWRLGGSPGTNTLRASIPGTSLAVTFTATGTASGVSSSVAINSGNNQAAMVNTAVPIAPSVRLRDGANNPIPGVTVTFEVIEGGGSITGAVTTTNAQGIATVGSWTLGPVAQPNRLRATAPGSGFSNNPIIITGVGCAGGGGSGYAITLCFATNMSTAQRQVFETAAARWSTVITGDLPAETDDVGANQCGQGSPSVTFTVDDLVIFAAIEAIDGPGQVLGSASPCFIRDIGFLPSHGTMQFDSADLTNLENGGQLQAVILHEMGHVIGIGTLWERFNLLKDPSSSSNKLDTFYSGTNGIAGFDAIGGTTYTGGRKVPVENEFGDGTRNSHWRESILRNELMTGFVSSGTNPISLLTVRSLEDFGYVINQSAADAFMLTLTVRAPGGATPRTVQLMDDILDIPIYTIDRAGRQVRIR